MKKGWEPKKMDYDICDYQKIRFFCEKNLKVGGNTIKKPLKKAPTRF